MHRISALKVTAGAIIFYFASKQTEPDLLALHFLSVYNCDGRSNFKVKHKLSPNKIMFRVVSYHKFADIVDLSR